MNVQNRLGFVDGIKAFAALMVFHIHILNAYYPGIYTLKEEHFHTANGLEWWIGATPLNLVYAGKLGARIFLFLSAFLLARNYFLKEGNILFLRLCLKKYIRLVIPLLFVNLAICAMMYLGWYQNDYAAAAAGSTEFFGSYNQFVPNVWEAIKEAVWGCFVFGKNKYNGPIWFIQYEFWGCVGSALLLKLTGRYKIRYVFYAVIAVLLLRSDYLCMLLAVALADIMITKPLIVDKITAHRCLLWIFFTIALYFSTYPSYGESKGTMYEFFPPKVLFYYNIAIPVLFFCISSLKELRGFFEKPLFADFTRISYAFYLLHFPVLCTLGAAFFLAGVGKISYHILFLAGYTASLLITGIAAYFVTKFVTEPAENLSNKVGSQRGIKGKG